MTPTILDTLESTGLLALGSRAHLLRPDLSNRTVCGRYDLNRISDERLNRPAIARPACGVCHDPGWAGKRH